LVAIDEQSARTPGAAFKRDGLATRAELPRKRLAVAKLANILRLVDIVHAIKLGSRP